ncbi:MAG: hypothetical protein MK078_05095 [Crocinitomicaceae bacterium]|nr:hypothetical protein [Crocinitomicaceae bacterium]
MKGSLLLLFTLFMAIGMAQVNQKDSQGRKQGVWKKFHANSGAMRYTGTFKDDKPVGKFLYYYETGQLQTVMIYRKDGSSYCEMYHQSGKIMSKGKYVDQEKDSLWYFFDDRGVLSYQETYKAGKLDGQRVVYYAPVDGQYRVMESTYYKNGVKHGEHKEYYQSTRLKCECTYVDGNINGAKKYYHTNGKLERIERYKYATRHGVWIYYNDKGVKEGMIVYWEGRLMEGEQANKAIEKLKAESGN